MNELRAAAQDVVDRFDRVMNQPEGVWELDDEAAIDRLRAALPHEDTTVTDEARGPDYLRGSDISMAEHSDTRSECPVCGEWRDNPTADCAGCGYNPPDEARGPEPCQHRDVEAHDEMSGWRCVRCGERFVTLDLARRMIEDYAARASLPAPVAGERSDNRWSHQELLDIFDRTADRPGIRAKIRDLIGTDRAE